MYTGFFTICKFLEPGALSLPNPRLVLFRYVMGEIQVLKDKKYNLKVVANRSISDKNMHGFNTQVVFVEHLLILVSL